MISSPEYIFNLIIVGDEVYQETQQDERTRRLPRQCLKISCPSAWKHLRDSFLTQITIFAQFPFPKAQTEEKPDQQLRNIPGDKAEE